MKLKGQDDLARHARRSRVIWYPGATPPYSSLWITIQRFLMLNQPTRAAFTQDFLMRTVNGCKVPLAYTPAPRSLNTYALASAQSPLRLARFIRVLGEQAHTFGCSHVGQFQSLVRPYFGDFAVCPHCLAQGFHSVLYSFEGLRTCPIHAVELQSLARRGTLASELFLHALGNPFGRCLSLQELMGFASARRPAAHPERDLALAEVAKWLMDVGTRCWLGPRGSHQTVPFDELTQRISQLRGSLKLAQTFPNWVDADGRLALDSARMQLATLGGVKLDRNDLVDVNDRRALKCQSNIHIYRRTLCGDFKAFARHLKRCALGPRGAYWLGRLANTSSAAEMEDVFRQGAAQARRAWRFLTWRRHLFGLDFNPKLGLGTLPMQLTFSGDIPVCIAKPRLGLPSQTAHDFVRLWIARWISAAGLVALWRYISGLTDDEMSPATVGLDCAVLQSLREPKWSLGIAANHELVFCIDDQSELSPGPAQSTHSHARAGPSSMPVVI